MILFLKIEKDHVFFIKLKDVLVLVLVILKKDDYQQTVDDAIEFVSGKSRKIQKNLSSQMEKASEELDFEKAAILRDRIKALNIIQSSQRINEANLVEADVIAGYKESGKTCIQVFFYRSKAKLG